MSLVEDGRHRPDDHGEGHDVVPEISVPQEEIEERVRDDEEEDDDQCDGGTDVDTQAEVVDEHHSNVDVRGQRGPGTEDGEAVEHQDAVYPEVDTADVGQKKQNLTIDVTG